MSYRPLVFAAALLLPLPASAGVIVMKEAAPPAAAPLAASPITPGFWAWPAEKALTPEAVAEACRGSLAVQFADGRYFGITFHDDSKPSTVTEAGTCTFDVGAQVERCSVRLTPDDGEAYTTDLESRFSTEPDGTLKMSVASTITSGPDKSSKGTFDVHPVRCPDDVAWSALLDEKGK